MITYIKIKISHLIVHYPTVPLLGIGLPIRITNSMTSALSSYTHTASHIQVITKLVIKWNINKLKLNLKKFSKQIPNHLIKLEKYNKLLLVTTQ